MIICIGLYENHGQKVHRLLVLKIREIHGEFTSPIHAHIVLEKTSQCRALLTPQVKIITYSPKINCPCNLSKHKQKCQTVSGFKNNKFDFTKMSVSNLLCYSSK